MMNIHENSTSQQFRTFSPYGPFQANYHHQHHVMPHLTDESLQLRTYSCNREGVASSHSSDPHRYKSNASSIHNVRIVSSDRRFCKQICFYIQQVMCVTVILTGLALGIAGAIQNRHTGEHYVFVYIGVILIGVGTLLFILQWNVKRKTRKRQKRNLANNNRQHVNLSAGETVGSHQAVVEPLVNRNNPAEIDNVDGPNLLNHVNSRTSPSECLSVLSQRQQFHPFLSHHHHHRHQHENFDNRDAVHNHSNSNHIPRYDILSSQATAGYHDLAHSVPVQDKV